VLTLATLGVVLSVGVTAWMPYLGPLELPAALAASGVLISARSGFGSNRHFRKAGVHGGCGHCVGGESLLE